MEIGKHHDLIIDRLTSVGLFLSNEVDEDILLPNKYCPEEFELEDTIRVFVYKDYAERKIATTLQPKILLNEFALLQVADANRIGAFMDWGLEKHLFVPFQEQRVDLEANRWYIIYMALDEKTDRLFGSNKLNKYLQNDALTVDVGEEVDILIMRKTDLGYTVIIDNLHTGLIYNNEIFKEVNIGDKFKGYVKAIREDNKIDISLQPIGFENFKDANSNLIIKHLNKNNGHLPLNDKSSPDDIYQQFGISKKAFKKSVGNLYKLRKISIEKDGIKLIQDE